MRSHVTRRTSTRPRFSCHRFQYRKRYEVTCDLRSFRRPYGGLRGFNTASGMRSHVTFNTVKRRTESWSFNTASGMRSHVTIVFWRRPAVADSCFNTASGMRSHVTLCLGGRRNRRLKSWFWKTSSKPNMRSHFFGCHYILCEYVMTPPSLI